jgi:hypothetical protein
MKFLRWLFVDDSSEEAIREEYAELSDVKLAQIKPAELTPVGLKCYRAELERRRGLTQPAPKALQRVSAKPR